MNSDQNLNESADDLAREMRYLCTRLHDEVITEDEINRLNQLMGENAQARQLYLQHVLLDQMMQGFVGKRECVEAEQLGIHIDSAESGSTLAPADMELHEPSRMPIFWIAGLAAMLVVGVFAISILLSGTEGSAPDIAMGGMEQTQQSQPENSKVLGETLVSYVSSSARWQNPNDAPSAGSPVEVGQILQIEEGAIELTYGSGTKLMLLAPARFLIQKEGGELSRGGLIASVPEAGKGFTVSTPNGKVVDLGTEFGLAVDDFGTSEVSVFRGRVDAFPITAERDGKEKIELFKGDCLQWERGSVTELSADLRKFSTSILGRDIGVSESDVSIVDRFRNALNDENWTTLGDVDSSAKGLVLKNSGSFDERPYLISKELYDPLQGAVTVTCDFQFGEFKPNENPQFSIMSRSSNVRGTSFEPWNGILSSCVCCSFGAPCNIQEEVLQTSVKLGSENQMSSVSWAGFLAPKPNVRYRMVMRDDGINVSLTVFLHENPSIRKTVSCRSLFQSKTNHIAIGGLVDGSVIVDRIEVKQDRSSAKLSNYNEFCSLIRIDPNQLELEQRAFDRLVPPDAELLFEDRFDNSSLDESKWKTLGNVTLTDSALQLGLPNSDGHIDTWKARPYLLTREQLDSDKGKLTVVGRMSFADNFLVGYGATFAVMTQANDQRGDNLRGWENSILQRGVRATFWPAAADNSHSLEIHEKPQPNTITLLAKSVVDVDPFVRTYVFRLFDDGESVTFTIVDPNQPDKEMSVSSPVHSSAKRGHIGFESCWGSPVKLEEVRIYRSN